MRVIHPATLVRDERRLAPLLAVLMIAVGTLAALMAILAARAPATAALLAVAAVLSLGVGSYGLIRALRPDPERRSAHELELLLRAVFDDAYTLIVAPRLPIGASVSGLLVGPSGVRVLTVRRWEGRYRVRGRGWELESDDRRGWIGLPANPSYELSALIDRVTRWTASVGLGSVPVTGAVVFPWSRSRLVLEEPADEVVTVDNAPWWANRIGRVQRVDPGHARRFVDAVLQAGETFSRGAGPPEPSTRP